MAIIHKRLFFGLHFGLDQAVLLGVRGVLVVQRQEQIRPCGNKFFARSFRQRVQVVIVVLGIIAQQAAAAALGIDRQHGADFALHGGAFAVQQHTETAVVGNIIAVLPGTLGHMAVAQLAKEFIVRVLAQHKVHVVHHGKVVAVQPALIGGVHLQAGIQLLYLGIGIAKIVCHCIGLFLHSGLEQLQGSRHILIPQGLHKVRNALCRFDLRICQSQQAIHRNYSIALGAQPCHMDSAALLAVILVQPAPVFGFRIRTAALQLQVMVQPVFIARAQVLLQHLGFAHAGFHQLNIHPLLFVQVLEQRLAHGSVLRLSAGLSGQKHAVIRITKIGIFQRVIPVNGCRVVFQVGVDGVILFALHFHGFGHSGFLTVSRFRGSGTGGNGFLCRHISIQKVLQNRNVGSPIRIHHGAVIHAVAHAIGALHRHGHLVCCHAQKARQLHHQGSDLSFCKVGLHHRQGGVQQVVQLGD